LGIYPKECKSTLRIYAFINMFISTFFTVAKLWNQTNEWIKQLWYINEDLEDKNDGIYGCERGNI
jgi:hypothetical protein